MKKLLAIFLSLTCVSAFAQQREPNYRGMGTAVTNVAASTTNLTAGEIIQLADGQSPVRFWLKAEGNAASTNAGGISTTNGLTVYISTASGNLGTTNSFDTALLSNVKLQIKDLGSQTNVVSDWVVLQGARFIRVGAIRNELLGSVSNISVVYGYPK